MSLPLQGPQTRGGVLSIDPYVPGRSSAPSGQKVHKLSSNETPLGPSPRAVAAFRDAAQNLARYPDGAATVLRTALADLHGLNPERLVCGNGSDELLSLLASAYVGPGDEGIFTEHGFLVYRIAILAAGGTPIVAPEKTLTADVDAILARVTARTKILFLANPNNPTGTYLPISEVRRLHAHLPSSVLLVLDAAYAEYVRRNDYESGIELVSNAENVVMTRTFSKVYGLAALRIGWLYGPASVVDALNRLRGPFNVSAPAILAGAAALSDRAFLTAAIEHNEQWRDWLAHEIKALSLNVTPSVGNFLLVHFSQEKGRTAANADDFLVNRGIILRRMEAYGLPNALRLTVGDAEANRAVVAALAAFMDLQP